MATWIKCKECVFSGSLVPKKGGLFYGQYKANPERVTQPNIPYCREVNMAISLDDSHDCSRYVEQPKDKEATP